MSATWTLERGYRTADGTETIVTRSTHDGTPRLGAYEKIRPETDRQLIESGVVEVVERVTIQADPNAGLDDTDRAILADREAGWNLTPADFPRVGDFIRFADGVERIVSHVWRGWDDDTQTQTDPESIQTSDGGSFYLGGRSPYQMPGSMWGKEAPQSGYVSFSGSLYSGIPADSLTLTDEARALPVWIFHHDQHRAHNGVSATITARLFTTTKESARL